MTFVIRELRRSDVAASSLLHHDVLGMEFLARAGVRFLRSYHRAWIDSPHALALVAVDGEGMIVGAVLGSTRPAAQYRTMVRRHGLTLMAWLVLRAVSHPRFARELLATRGLRYALGLSRMLGRGRPARAPIEDELSVVLDVAGQNDQAIGEVTHVMVSRDLQSQGLGRLMLHDVHRSAQTAGLNQLVLVTPPDLSARGFYEHLGWQSDGELTSRSGEPFVRYRLMIEHGGSRPEPAAAG